MARNERTLGRAGRWDGDIVVAVPAGTLPTLHDGTGATWLLYTDWLDALRELASTPAPRP